MSFNEWRKFKLGNIIDDISMGPFGSNLKVDNFISSGVPVIRGGNLNDGGFEDPHFVFVSEEKAQTLKRSLAYPDDLVFTHRGTIGQVGIIPKDKHPKYLVSQSQLKLTVNRKFLVPRYLFYFFKSGLGQYELLKNASQVGVPAIASPTKSLKEIDITVPDIATQSRISEILLSLDEKIEINRQANETLEAIAQAIFKEWFVDFNFPGATEKSKDTLNGFIPADWKIEELGRICKTTSGGTPSRKVLEYYNGGTIPWIKSKELNNSFVCQTEEKITEGALSNSSAKLLPRHTVLIAMYGATVGEIGITGMIASCNQAICAILPNEQYPYTFIYEYLKTSKAEIISRAVGSAQQNISQELLKKMKLIMPPLDLVKAYHGAVAGIYELIEKNILEIQTLTQLRDTLLPKLMKGEIPIPEH